MGIGKNDALTAIILFAITTLGSFKVSSQPYQLNLAIEANEHWWAGVITDGHLFPVESANEYAFDFYGNTKFNQGQPLLISSKGRYIWNEEPFLFSFDNGEIHCESSLGEFTSGTAGNTLKEVYLYCSKNFFPPSGKIPGEMLFTQPQFNSWIEFTYYQNQEGLLDYARNIVESGFGPGVLMIDAGWYKDYGNYEFDPVAFPDPKGMMKELKELGFTVMLWVCPYYSPDGPFWKEQWLDYTNKEDTIWIVNAENPNFPAVMQWWDGFSNVIDLSNPKGYRWFKEKLNYLQEEYGVDGFKLDGGDAVHYSGKRMLTKTSSYKKDITPNEHSELFVKLGTEYKYNEYRAAWKMGGQPVAMRLWDKKHNWEDLQKLVPGIITQGLMGYSFTCPDMIGGGEYLSFIDLEEIDQELVVRSAQCHALMPMMQFSAAPWRILNKENLEICVEMSRLHASMSDEILELARESARTGEPIVRSLEYEFPGNGYEKIIDQFLLGPAILVAPVLEQGAVAREVVFPPGKWRSANGKIHKGPSVQTVDAGIDVLPWFRRVS